MLLLERSIEAAQIRTFATGPSAADVEQAEVLEAELFSLANPGVSGAFAKGEIEELYVVAMTGSKVRRLLVAKAMAKLDAKTAAYIKNLKLDADAPESRGVAYLTSIGRLRVFSDSDKVRKARLEVDLQVEEDQKTPVAGGGQPSGSSAPVIASAHPQPDAQAEQKARAARMAAIRNSSASKGQSVRFGYEVMKPAAAR